MAWFTVVGASLGLNGSPLPRPKRKHAPEILVRLAKQNEREAGKMKVMTKIMMATALVSTTAVSFDLPADARTRHHYSSRTRYYYKYCRHSSAATGKVVGGVTGAVVGSRVLGGGLLGAAAGAVGGVVAGGAIDRSMTAHRRCRYYR